MRLRSVSYIWSQVYTEHCCYKGIKRMQASDASNVGSKTLRKCTPKLIEEIIENKRSDCEKTSSLCHMFDGFITILAILPIIPPINSIIGYILSWLYCIVNVMRFTCGSIMFSHCLLKIGPVVLCTCV